MKSYCHIYIGDGKGKSTAALGLTLRAAGADLRVFYSQFLKQENSSELNSLALLPNITVQKGEPTDGFLFFMDEAQRAQAAASALSRLKIAKEHLRGGNYDMVILDEFLWLLSAEIVSVEDALELIHTRAENCELVLTGGHAPAELIDAADYVSEIQKIRHPFDQDAPPRRGIEF